MDMQPVITMKHFESFGLDISNECLWHQGAKIALAPKPFAVLRYLVDNPARLITHDELLDALWPETYVQPQVLRTYVLELRKVLGDDPAQPRFIQTLPKRGYCFVAPITEHAPAETARTAHSVQAQVTHTGIVGREAELAELTAQADLLSASHRKIVFITGEAGIGKTALVEAFCQQTAASQTVSIACGQCMEGFGAKEEYYPIMDALSQLCASADGERACRILATLCPAWLAPLRREYNFATITGTNTDTDRKPGDLCAALEELASERPLILVFEDLNWADSSTLHLISALARRRAPAKLMVLATYRPQGVATEHPFKAIKQDLLLRRLCTELALQPLPKTALRALLSKELKQSAPPTGLTSFVHQHSEGNPLFAIAILEHLIAQHFLVSERIDGVAQWKQSTPFDEIECAVPAGLAQMIELEIARLTPREQRMLEAGSLISVAFPAWAVAAALDEDAAEVEEACDQLAQRLYFLERAGQDDLPGGSSSAFYVFAHGLYREVLYQRQSARRRAKWHVRIAERLAQLFSGREANVAREMAFHYEAAGNWQRAVDALRSAARHAHQRQAYAEATDLLEHTLRIAANLGEADCAAAASDLTQARAALV